jgi:hypothetical protein
VLFRVLFKILGVFINISQVLAPGFFLLIIQANSGYQHGFRKSLNASNFASLNCGINLDSRFEI